jgi:predicted lipoprotein with Yx(FWY)xxD motif
VRCSLPLIVLFLCCGLSQSAGAASGGEADVPEQVLLTARGHGWILNNADGMTLYTYMKDPFSGVPVCAADCAELWPPLVAPASAEVGGEWSVVDREDGTRQWVFRGKPLYTYSLDNAPGDMNGDELQQQWYVAVKPVPLPPGFNAYKTTHGYLLADLRNHTLYTSSADASGVSVCNGDCAKTWVPVEAWWRARSTLDDWSVIDRADGTKQWAYKGRPLYRYAGDFAPGEITGNDIESYTALILESPPPVPDWVTYQNSDAGPLLADASGRTLYTYTPPSTRAFGIGIGRDMATPDLWTPVYADGAKDPIGHWSVAVLEDGRDQWAYKGLKLYVHKLDTEPGDLNGQRSSDRYWRTIMKDGQVMAGSGR